MIRRPPRSTPLYSSAASDVYKRQACLESAIIAPVQKTTNPQMAIWIASIRFDFRTGRLRSITWCDTEDMVVNALTKIDLKAELPLEIGNLDAVMQRNELRFAHAYRRTIISTSHKGTSRADSSRTTRAYFSFSVSAQSSSSRTGLIFQSTKQLSLIHI